MDGATPTQPTRATHPTADGPWQQRGGAEEPTKRVVRPPLYHSSSDRTSSSVATSSSASSGRASSTSTSMTNTPPPSASSSSASPHPLTLHHSAYQPSTVHAARPYGLYPIAGPSRLQALPVTTVAATAGSPPPPSSIHDTIPIHESASTMAYATAVPVAPAATHIAAAALPMSIAPAPATVTVPVADSKQRHPSITRSSTSGEVPLVVPTVMTPSATSSVAAVVPTATRSSSSNTSSIPQTRYASLGPVAPSPMSGTSPARSPSNVAVSTARQPAQPPRQQNVTVRQFLELLDFSEYIHTFISEGFDRIESLLEIQEEDFEAMGIKRGHRRIIQRELATMKGIPITTPLPIALGRSDDETHRTTETVQQTNRNVFYISQNRPSDGNRRNKGRAQQDHSRDLAASTSNASMGASTTASTGTVQQNNGHSKRKYRRHPKPDPFAPEKPPSAYVSFTNKVREEMKGKSFAEIARIGGERWQNLDKEEKEVLEAKAAEEKERYAARLAAYKNTKEYAQYQEYLNEFRKKYHSQDDNADSPPATSATFTNRRRSRGEAKAENMDDDDASLHTTVEGGTGSRSDEEDSLASEIGSPRSTRGPQSAMDADGVEIEGDAAGTSRQRTTTSSSLNRIMDHPDGTSYDRNEPKRLRLDGSNGSSASVHAAALPSLRYRSRTKEPSSVSSQQQGERSKLSLATSNVRGEDSV